MPEQIANQAHHADEQPAAGISPKDRAAFDAGVTGDEPYTLGPDSLAQAGVPRGAVTQHRWKNSAIYPGTERDYWLYIPSQYDGSRPACLMVFQDGPFYLGPEVNAPIVFDNLIQKRDMPVTLGLFVNPGDKGPGTPGFGGSDNRSFEYDSLGDQYARFLIEELLPEIEKHHSIVGDPAGRAICGMSSGGICAFTVAWERPGVFSKVVSHCGSFANIRGGHAYPSLIRRTARKPLRVFLQTGARDLDVVFGNWPLANQDMAAALAYREYDYQFVFGSGGHTLKHGGAIFPDTLRWLWRDYPKDSL
jgi:enterochelin esterase-like enzyme